MFAFFGNPAPPASSLIEGNPAKGRGIWALIDYIHRRLVHTTPNLSKRPHRQKMAVASLRVCIICVWVSERVCVDGRRGKEGAEEGGVHLYVTIGVANVNCPVSVHSHHGASEPQLVGCRQPDRRVRLGQQPVR